MEKIQIRISSISMKKKRKEDKIKKMRLNRGKKVGEETSGWRKEGKRQKGKREMKEGARERREEESKGGKRKRVERRRIKTGQREGN